MSLAKTAPNQGSHHDLASRMDAQTASPLFSLPAELRLKVYRSLLAGKTFHVRLRETRRKPYYVNDSDLCIHERDENGYGCTDCNGPSLNTMRLLSLTKSCRKAYLETINIFYEENAFIFFDFEDIVAFDNNLQKMPINTRGGDRLKIRHLRVSHPWLSESCPDNLHVLLDGLRILELGWNHFLWADLDGNAPCKLIRILVQVRGVELRFSEVEEKPLLKDLRAALKEIMGQPKSADTTNLLPASEEANAELNFEERSLQQLARLAPVFEDYSTCIVENKMRRSQSADMSRRFFGKLVHLLS